MKKKNLNAGMLMVSGTIESNFHWNDEAIYIHGNE